MCFYHRLDVINIKVMNRPDSEEKKTYAALIGLHIVEPGEQADRLNHLRLEKFPMGKEDDHQPVWCAMRTIPANIAQA
ncbi:hypothetical protein UNDYM_4432 [Undibacterium sp. YM2]|nr:hypothetical protein UNDYM_4432 [Undibacterium sp. YM2]